MNYQIIEDQGGGLGPILRGAALDLWKFKGPEVVISGPAETGKTYGALFKLDALLWKYKNSSAVMVRRIRDTIRSSCMQTYTHKVLREGSPVKPYGGENPSWFDYPNGSRLWLAGMDDPGKVLSSEHDFIYVNQAEELRHDDWQVLTTRTTGRAGHAPYGQVLGDANPGAEHHWIKHRESLKLLESRHEDNPTLWDDKLAQWTEQGIRTLAALDNLTGVRKERLRYGRWVSAEGTVYEFDAAVHLVDRFPIPRDWLRVRVIDFGYTNPFVCQWWALDPDGRLWMYREIYMSQRTVRVHSGDIKLQTGNERIMVSIADHDAEDRATLSENGIVTIPAKKEIAKGIQAVEERLKKAGDGKPRLFILKDSLVERDETLYNLRAPVCTEQEFDVYMWPKGKDGKAHKEVPVDKDNHGMDCVRYVTRWADDRQRQGGMQIPPPTEKQGDDISRAPPGVFLDDL